MSNTVITENNVEVYEDRIFELADEYIDTLRTVLKKVAGNTNADIVVYGMIPQY